MTSSHPLTSQAGTYRFAFAPFPSRHQIAEKHRKEFDMKNFARGALIAVAAVTVIGGYGAGAASAHPTGALDRLASVHQSSIENSFPHHPHHPIAPHRLGPNPFGHEGEAQQNVTGSTRSSGVSVPALLPRAIASLEGRGGLPPRACTEASASERAGTRMTSPCRG